MNALKKVASLDSPLNVVAAQIGIDSTDIALQILPTSHSAPTIASRIVFLRKCNMPANNELGNVNNFAPMLRCQMFLELADASESEEDQLHSFRQAVKAMNENVM